MINVVCKQMNVQYLELNEKLQTISAEKLKESENERKPEVQLNAIEVAERLNYVKTMKYAFFECEQTLMNLIRLMSSHRQLPQFFWCVNDLLPNSFAKTIKYILATRCVAAMQNIIRMRQQI